MTNLELELRADILGDMERRRRPYLDSLRRAMRDRYVARHAMVRQLGYWAALDVPVHQCPDVAYVTADDARAAFERMGPGPEVNRNLLGAVFRTREWRQVPYRWVYSTTPGSHGNRLPAWEWVG